MNIYEPSEVELILQGIQAKVDRAGQLISIAAGEINDAHGILWALSDDKLLSVLNGLGPVAVQGIFETHESRGSQINDILDEFTIPNKNLVRIGSGKPVKFSMETGQFEMNYPEPEEEGSIDEDEPNE